MLHIPADITELAGIRQFVREHAVRAGADRQQTDDLVQAVDESATNSIVHGYRGAEGWVEVEIDVLDSALVVRLRDQAPPFDPTDAARPRRQAAAGAPALPRTGRLSGARTDRRSDLSTHHRGKRADADQTNSQQREVDRADITVTQENARVPVAVMSLEGELDAASYLDALASAREVVEGGASHMLLDLEQLTYIGSSGIFVIHSVAMFLRGEEPPNPDDGWGAIHQADQDESAASPNLKLLAPQPQVDRALERSGMKRFFETYTDRAEALASF